MAEVAKKKKAVKKKKAAKNRSVAVRGKSAARVKELRRVAELAAEIGLKSVTIESKIGGGKSKTEKHIGRPYKGEERQVDEKTLSAADSAIVDEHKRLYEMLANCADVDEFNRLYKRYAELDGKVARITNRDANALERCMYENSYSIVK